MNARLAALRRRNLESPPAAPRAFLDDMYARVAHLPVSERLLPWAYALRDRTAPTYVLGDSADGYATHGRLVDDAHTDCLLFFCRVVECAAARCPEDAIDRALRGRFGGGDLTELVNAVVDDDGVVDYGHERYLRFSRDLIRSGAYGRDVTAMLGDAVPDGGSPHTRPGTLRYLTRVEGIELRNGDGLFFVLNEANEAATRIRRETGSVIGHVGFVSIEAGAPHLLHAASNPLPGVYEGGRVERVRLDTYLERVERFQGYVVVRLD